MSFHFYFVRLPEFELAAMAKEHKKADISVNGGVSFSLAVSRINGRRTQISVISGHGG